MRVLIAGATDSRQYVKSYRSFAKIATEPGDEIIEPDEFYRGDLTRIRFGEEFLRRKEFDALLLLDLDMIHPPDLLAKLRAHDLDMVSGHYFKRGSSPIMSICTVGQKWPFEPLYDVPRSGLHKIATTGFGSVLMKREALEAITATLGEREPLFGLGPMPEASGDLGMFGSDIRFFIRAKKLGYQLWLDASVESLHATIFWVGSKLYDMLRPYQTPEWTNYWRKHLGGYGGLHGMDKDAALVRLKLLKEALREAEEQAARWENKVKVISGQIAEREFDAQIDAKRPAKLPILSEAEVRELVAKRKDVPGDIPPETVKQKREDVYRREAMEFVDELQAPEST